MPRLVPHIMLSTNTRITNAETELTIELYQIIGGVDFKSSSNIKPQSSGFEGRRLAVPTAKS